jgi:small conductance mechanosensitive channel
MKPFKIGDSIEGDDVSGTVKEITIFYTKIINAKNGLAVIPNGRLSNNKIVNYTTEGIRKDFITIPIHYESNLKDAIQILNQLISEEEKILKEPVSQVLVEEMASNCIRLSIRYTAKIDVFWEIHWRIMEQAKNRLEAAGIQVGATESKVN